jgi:hypothetical protein
MSLKWNPVRSSNKANGEWKYTRGRRAVGRYIVVATFPSGCRDQPRLVVDHIAAHVSQRIGSRDQASRAVIPKGCAVAHRVDLGEQPVAGTWRNRMVFPEMDADERPIG